MVRVLESKPLPAIPTLEEILRGCPELKRADIENLQSWMRKQSHLPKMSSWSPFLHCNYYSLEGAKKTIENHFTIRTHAPEMFQNRDILSPPLREQLRLFEIGILSSPDSSGHSVLVGRLLPFEASEYNVDQSLKLCWMAVDEVILEQPACPGYVVVLDCKGITMAHIARASISTIKCIFTYAKDGLGMRLKAVHVINVTSVMDSILMILKPFLPEELLRLLHFHSGQMEEFYQAVPRELLPKEYGGEMGSMSDMHELTVKRLEKHRAWLLDLEKLLVDEAKRPGKARNVGAVFGVEGSFKKLDID